MGEILGVGCSHGPGIIGDPGYGAHYLRQHSGQHEFLNWICLAGAMEGRKANVLAWAETYTINSCRCVALFPPS
jgi:hypothetical protein